MYEMLKYAKLFRVDNVIRRYNNPYLAKGLYHSFIDHAVAGITKKFEVLMTGGYILQRVDEKSGKGNKLLNRGRKIYEKQTYADE